MEQLRDYTSTAFGYLIAFVLTGMAGLYSGTFYSSALNEQFNKFTKTDASVGLFFVVLLVSITISLLITPLRAIVFEEIAGRHLMKEADPGGGERRALELPGTSFEKLSKDAARLTAFRAAVDENYRYHQFWGAMVFVLAVWFVGVAKNIWFELSPIVWVLALAAEALIWSVTVWAAWEAYRRF